MKIASLKPDTHHLTANEEAFVRCQTALELKDKSDYRGALLAMGSLWTRVGDRPEIEGLHSSVAAEVLLCVGVLTGWIGSKMLIGNAQELAKDLITESVNYFESVNDSMKVAAARVELAYCYWREGELNEARLMIEDALRKLTTPGNTRARALLKLTTVEFSAGRHSEALRILRTNASLYRHITNHSTLGVYHNQLAIALRNLAVGEKRKDYLRKAVSEFQLADSEFKLARNSVFRADVKNNVGLVLFNLGRFKEAHKYLDEARRLTVSFKDKARTAQIDETRAEVFLAEKKYEEAEAVARRAASALEKSGHRCLVADALIVQGIALARQQKKDQAYFVFQKALDLAHQVGALNKAGLAALTMIEEIDQLSPATLQAAYGRAREWLANSQDQEVLQRISRAADKLASTVLGQMSPEQATEILLTKPCDLQEKILEYERGMIRQALVQANGRITRAASLLGLSYQGLGYIIQSRHPDLLKERSPVRRRLRRSERPHD